jgi:phage FluMu protein Com
MTKLSRTKLVPLEVRHEDQSLETAEASQQEYPKSELEVEIDCPRCSEIMSLYSKFDELGYSCESCSFSLKCV